MAAFAAKYCAVTELARPSKPSPMRSRQRFTIKPLSPAPIPVSMMSATTSGTSSSRSASRSLKSGPRMLSSV